MLYKYQIQLVIDAYSLWQTYILLFHLLYRHLYSFIIFSKFLSQNGDVFGSYSNTWLCCYIGYMIPIHLVLPAAEEFPPNAIPIKVHHIWKFFNFFRILIFFHVNTSRHTLFVDLPNNSTVSLSVCTFSLLYPNTSSKHKILGPAMAKAVEEKPIRILVPDKSFDLEQKPAEGLYNELSKCTPKTLAYFD